MQINNLLRGATFFQHSGVSIVYVFMPILAQSLTSNIFEVGLTIASFFLAQILSSLYFGRISDAKGVRLTFIRIGFVSCAVMFGLHYIADNSFYLLLVRLGAGVASGMMVPAMLAYTYESGKDKSKVASVISFHALGWMAGIVAAGIANNEKTIFLISAGLFLVGLAFSFRLPHYTMQKEVESGATKKVIIRNKYLFLSLLLRHIGATSVWTILPLVLTQVFGAKLYEVSIVYIANTASAFVLMNLMAGKITMKDVTKFKIGIGLTVFVFAGMAVMNSWWMAIPCMALVGITWAFLYIGGSIHLMENNPKSTSTGVFNSTISIANVIGPVVAGSIAFWYKESAVMYFAVGICIIAFLVSLKIKK
ncbi:MAG: MFS transporter [Nitrososphaeria archaeon]|nr:MFS transporter [Nitrososphaeria archaeon]NDB51259.1 MFS transporter [Nitrosopumilaceae archaeon]NDB89800.1 MFS transporter [Nitrososphaerota archaeon]NDB46135.1 MFS transporter [Nitrososphaeria archaeon]NDB62899.1 MFS transporter [Nitrosopumilaceae archaeon]